MKYKRDSADYQKLIARSYDALYENVDFRTTLEATQNEKLCHSIGGQNPRKTVLTEAEFIKQLYRLRSKLHTEGAQDET